MTPKMKLTHKIVFGYLKVYWSGVLFFHVKADGMQFQSHENNGIYSIGLHSDGAIINLEFDTFAKWKAVLDLLDKATEQK